MVRHCATALVAACLAGGVFAQYPDKPIRFVVPQAPGSATDTVSRILAPEMSKFLD
jgi:tripartite-type tricarboxylate transporter receptor subunit TctC